MSGAILTRTQIDLQRAKLALPEDGQKITDNAGACRLINERGYVLLMPLKEIPLPSLSAADAALPWEGFEITDRAWQWKETLPQQKLCAYAKVIRKRGTFISWRLYSAFLRIYGPDGDPEYEYENGRIDRAVKDLYTLVDKYGPLDSRELWNKAKPLFGGKRNRFTLALEWLQSHFYLTVAGGSLEGWTRHTWDLIERHAPPETIRHLPTLDEARSLLLLQTIRNCYAAPERMLRSILGWPPKELRRSIESLQNQGLITTLAVGGESKPWLQAI